MDDLITWLKAQIDADEEAAQKAWSSDWRGELRESRQHIVTVGVSQVQDGVSVASGAPSVLPHIAAHSPARVLREVEAKRRILDDFRAATAFSLLPDTPGGGYASALADVVRTLALPFSDRPGYREEWRP